MEERYSPSPRLFVSVIGWSWPWGNDSPVAMEGALTQRLEALDPPKKLWMASTGSPSAMERKLKPLRRQAELAGYRCEQQATDLTHAVLLHCRSETSRPRE